MIRSGLKCGLNSLFVVSIPSRSACVASQRQTDRNAKFFEVNARGGGELDRAPRFYIRISRVAYSCSAPYDDGRNAKDIIEILALMIVCSHDVVVNPATHPFSLRKLRVKR